MNDGPCHQVWPVSPIVNRGPAMHVCSPRVVTVGRIVREGKHDRVVEKAAEADLPDEVSVEARDYRQEGNQQGGLLLDQQAQRFASPSALPHQKYAEANCG